MGSQSVEIIRQGIWASLTGGWYYDPHQNVFCNTFHLYLWLYLVCVPFCVYLYATWWWIGWLSHLVVLTVVAVVVKGTNFLLHHMFDTGECLEEEILPGTPSSEPFRPTQNGHQRASSFEALEMQVVGNRGLESDTPPVGCSSRNSVMEGTSNVAPNASQAPAVIDLKVDVHHKDSSGSEEGSLKPENKDAINLTTTSELRDPGAQSSNIPSVKPVKNNISNAPTLSPQNEDEWHEGILNELHAGFLALKDENCDSCKLFAKRDSLSSTSNEISSKFIMTNVLDCSLPSKSLMTPDHEDSLASNRDTRLEDDLENAKGKWHPSKHSHQKKSALTSRSCRGTPDPLIQSRNLSNIKGERSISAPNFPLQETSELQMNFPLQETSELQMRLSPSKTYHQKTQQGPSVGVQRSGERKHKRSKEERRSSHHHKSKIDPSPKKSARDKEDNKQMKRDKEGNNSADADTDEEVTTKDSSASLLLMRNSGIDNSKGTATTSRKGKPKPSSRVYHPLVCRTTSVAKASSSSGFSKDALKVTTLTFENIYADDESSSDTPSIIKMSSSSDEALSGCNLENIRVEGFPPKESEGIIISKLMETHIPHESKVTVVEESDTSHNEQQERGDRIKNAVDNKTTETTEESKEEDNLSEISNSSCPDIDWLFCHSDSDSEFSNVAKTILGENKKSFEEEEEEEDDSWNVVRSSPECNSDLAEGETKPNLRDPDMSKQGAIPKQRRQGLIVNELEDLSQEGGNSGREAAGVTMDLVRKMLDVFSSYPENRPRDIKKLLVLVSLEQDRRGSRENESASLDKESTSVIYSPDAEDLSSLPSPDSRQSISTPSSSKDKSRLERSSSSILHRKPAVRRRRHPGDVNITGVVTSDISVALENSSLAGSKLSKSKLTNDYQHTTLRGAVSYFDNSDEENSIDGETEKSKKRSNRKFSQDTVLPFSTFGTSSSPAIHLATCHDDTSNGAVHCFQDERGHWFTYTFNNSGINITSSAMPLTGTQSLQRTLHRGSESPINNKINKHPEEVKNPALAREDASLTSSSMSLCSGLTVVLDSQAPSSPVLGPPWSETCSKMPKEMRSPPHSSHSVATVPPTQRRASPSVSLITSRLRAEELRRGGILGEAMERQVRHLQRNNRETNPHRTTSASGPGISRNSRDVPFLSSGPQHLHLLNLGTPSNPLQLFTNAIFDRRRHGHRMNQSSSVITSEAYEPRFHHGIDEVMDMGFVKQLKFTTPAPQTVQYYKLRLYKNKTIKVKFDRLSLLALLDRNITVLESMFNIFLVIFVGVLGCLVMFKGFYHEFNVFIFCVVMASCQYSLFKSVQPDAASPTHGYNHIILYSRPAYFCLCCALILTIDFFLTSSSVGFSSFYLYGMNLTSPILLQYIRDFLLVFILFFPLIFSLGLLPQVNTFFMYILEQVDIHIFGGNATTSLSSAIYCVGRSSLAVLFLSGFAYGGLSEAAGSQHILYSIFCALIVAFSYHLSRSAANPSVIWHLIQEHMWPDELRQNNSSKEEKDEDTVDPLPKKLQTTVTNRLTHDTIVCSLIALIVCAVHSSTVFTVLLQGQFPDFLISVWIIACLLGLLNHYLIPQLRTQQPWMCIARPACMTHEYAQFEVYDAAKVMWFEKLYVWSCIIEKNIVYPVLFLCALTNDAKSILEKHPLGGTVILVICGLKCLRSVYSQPQFQYLILAFTILFFNWDWKGLSESFLVDYFFMSIIFSKVYEFLLKLKFIVTYIAPWQITWGSAFHAFAQPFSVPHSAMLFIQAAISAILSTPLNPILGSAIFVTSYVRPVKFWERDYNTKRMDHSNTRLSSLLEQNPGADDNNLNSIFYEHLTRSLQHSLCGDIIMGRWGPAVQGDCFVLASDNLNCLVHIIEVGNGLITFQVRGLEFRGTYCQQREVEAISEGVEEDGGCCCCEPGHIPHMLSANAAFNQRWLAWEVTATKYVLEGYSISENSATSMFQMFELRKILITYYVKSIIFYIIQSPKLEEWLENREILQSLEPLKEKKFADLDPTFHLKIDEDFDFKESGITRVSFCNVYLDWICFCVLKRLDKPNNISTNKDSVLVSLCLALSLLGRRALGPSSQCDNVEVFLQFLHSLFKGDIRPTCVRDEWVFADMELLRKVVAPAVRMSLKLHQDHFLLPDEYDNHDTLYNAVLEHQSQLVVCHEGDPAWRSAILSGRPSLLSLRHVNDDGEDKFKIIMLNKRHLLFRVIKINRECVRGLWAGQQQELVYLRNRNPERGSIQNAKQALRNIINSSCDQPIGYPIYVSPLTTSYADTHDQFSQLTGKTLTPTLIKDSVIQICNRLRQRCVEGCSSGSSGLNDECSRMPDSFQNNVQLHQVLSSVPLGVGPHLSQDGSPIGGLSLMTGPGSITLGGSLSGHSLSRGSLQANRGSIMSTVSSLVGPAHKQSTSTLASLAGLLGEAAPTVNRQGERESEGSVSSKEWNGREMLHGRDSISTHSVGKDKSIHNSRDSLSYPTHRENTMVWDTIGTMDYREKRGHEGSRGSSVSGITFLNRESVATGPLDPDWEWEIGPSELALCTTGSVHSLQSVGPTLLPHGGAPSPVNFSLGRSHPHEGHEAAQSHIQEGKFSSLHDLHLRPYHHHHHSQMKHPQHHLQVQQQHLSSQHHQNQQQQSQHHQKGAGPQRHQSVSWLQHQYKNEEPHTQHPHHEKKYKHHMQKHRVRILDANQVYDTLNLGRRIDVLWPDEWMRSRGGRSFWGHWVPLDGMEGVVVHTWMPHHPDPKLRSHVDRTILLVQIDDKFVPVAKNAVEDLSAEES